MRYIALLAITALLLALPTVNINHFLHLPTIDKEKIVEHDRGILGNLFNTAKTTDIVVSDIIKTPQTVKDINRVLRTARTGDIVNFYLVGQGGDAETVFSIAANIKASKATVHMIVEGNVYSGHAYLSTAGNTPLVMMNNTFLMFHTFSGYGTDCSLQEGTDRTVPNSEHCQAMIDAISAEVIRFIDGISFLTPEEKASILTGHDLYISDTDYNRRMAIKQELDTLDNNIVSN